MAEPLDMMLSPYRVLDFTDQRGEIAGMVFGDLGADVIRVEPREGSAARWCGPRFAAGDTAEMSLQFLAYNRNKRSIVLDPDEPRDQETLRRLIERSDFILESVPGISARSHRLGFDELRQINPRIVKIQISAFGTTGPAADWPASDLTIASLGGPVALQGVSERAPVRLSVPQVWRHAGVEAVVAAMVAHARMKASGQAQLVDVSAQCAMTWTMLNAMNAAAIQGDDFKRMGSLGQTGSIVLPVVFACRDGFVVAPPSSRMMASVTAMMIESGVGDPSWADRDWSQFDDRLIAGDYPEEELQAFERLLRNHDKQELLQKGLSMGVTFAPVNTIADVLEFSQLHERDYWLDHGLSDSSRVKLPGLFARLAKSPLSVRCSAPGIDQHGEEIRRELAQNPRVVKSQSAVQSRQASMALPFEGLKVADFSWVGVGPITARYFADHGATVVRVESELRPDVLRGAPPFKNGEPGWNRSQFFGDFNTSKLGLLLNLKEPAAIEIAKDLIAWADVYIEAFTPGTVGSLGLGYDVARALNPNIIMASTCLMGQSGSAASLAGYGYHAGAMAGFYEITGWPDLPPVGPWVAYTDTIAPRFLAATIMAALDHRERTGAGQHIDAAQFEMGLHFLAPEILDYQLNGNLATRMGNRAHDSAPQGVYPCDGNDQWCAISVDSDKQWQQLAGLFGLEKDAELDDLQGRLRHHDRIDEAVSGWTRSRSKEDVAQQLRQKGIPAGEVKRSSELLRDAQYAHRGFYHYLTHPEMGLIPYTGHQFTIEGYRSGPRFPAPILGEHSVDVLQGLLGMNDEQIAEAYGSGAIA